MKIQLLHPYLITNDLFPKRGSPHASGFDLFMPESGFIEGGQTAKVALGIASEIPKGWTALLLPRSSSGGDGLELRNTCGIIDPDYRGQWFAKMRHKTGMDFGWNKGDRILQAVLVPRYIEEVEVVQSVSATDRGTGGFGSTGT